MPKDSNWSHGIEPLPIRLSTTGMPVISVNCLIYAEVFEEITPPPTNKTGFSAVFTASIKVSISSVLPSFCNLYPRRLTSVGYSKSISASNTSFAISMTTGPGLPVEAIWNASLNTRGKSLTFFIK